MKISTRTRYGARALAELASVYPQSMLSIKELGERQKISPKYLEHIMRLLKAARLVNSVRGNQGGFVLTKPPTDITLYMVFTALEGSLAPVHCVDEPKSCPIQNVCPTRETWVEMKQHIEEFLMRTTIYDLAERKKEKLNSLNPTYSI
jgi:Rrf2 family protein